MNEKNKRQEKGQCGRRARRTSVSAATFAANPIRECSFTESGRLSTIIRRSKFGSLFSLSPFEGPRTFHLMYEKIPRIMFAKMNMNENKL